MDSKELKSFFEKETDSSKIDQTIESLLKEENVPAKISAIPRPQFEARFSEPMLTSLLSHSDPTLQATGSFVIGGSPEFRKKALDLALNLLKQHKIEAGHRSLALVIKFLAEQKTPLEKPLCERILSIISMYNGYKVSGSVSQEVTSQVVIITAKCIELNPDLAAAELRSITEDLITTDTQVSLTKAFALLSNVFHINASIGQEIFSIPQIQQQQFNKSHFVSESVVVAALEALSAACVNKECRTQVAVNFDTVVTQALASSQQESVALLAASILVKTKASSDTTSSSNSKEQADQIIALSEYFEFCLSSTQTSEIESQKYFGVALEGLAYTSLISTVRKRVIARTGIIRNLVAVIEKHLTQTPLVYCALCILANLTEYAPKLSAEQAKLRDLKNYAGKSNLASGDGDGEREPDTVVAARCKTILDLNVTSIISKNCPRYTGASRSIVAVLLRNLVTERTHRAKFSQQGGLAIVIYLLIPHDNFPPLDGKSTAIATSALAKTLISVDPAVALSQKISPLVTVKPLVTQLDGEHSANGLLDTFESLLALTNLAAGDDAVRDAIVRESFSKVEMLLTSSNELVQRASVELICNLAMSPHCAEKYLDGSDSAGSRLDILALFTDVDDRAARLAAAGALALLSEWGPAPAAMVKRQKTMQKLMELLDTKDSEMVTRAVVAVKNIAMDAREAVKGLGAIEKLRSVVQRSKDPEVIKTSMDAIKYMSKS